MAAHRPQDVDYELARAFNARDLSRACALYEDHASVRRLPEAGGDVATGDDDIREVMATYVDLDPTMRITGHHVTRAGQIAVVRSQWVIEGTSADGSPLTLTHHGIEVVREQSDGTWKFVIDHPDGAEVRFAIATADIPDVND